MKAIILAGGYAKRLWPLTKDKAKPLLEIAGKPCINYILEQVEKIEDVDKIYVSTNARFAEQFKKWADKLYSPKKIEIIVEKTTSEEEKLGAVGGIHYVIQSKQIDEDLLIVGGDNIFGLNLLDLMKLFKQKQSVVTAVWKTDNTDLLKACAVVKLNNTRVVEIEEKPDNPKSDLLGICCFIYPRKSIRLIKEYINRFGMRSSDTPGHLLQWVNTVAEINALSFDDYWFDIGTLENLREVDTFLTTRSKSAMLKKGMQELDSMKWVYTFEEGNKDMKELLGGKGANLAEMTTIGLPVPPGFTITTETCDYFNKNKKSWPDELQKQVEEAILKYRLGLSP